MRRYLWCFPGLGKSSLQLEGLSVIDADCEQFKFKNVSDEELHSNYEDKIFERDESYPENYLSYVRNVAADVVLLNCHIDLLRQLDKEELLLVYPDMSLISEYLQRFRDRGDHPSFVSHMEEEAAGIIQYVESTAFDKYRVDSHGTYLSDLFERNDFKLRIMNKEDLTKELWRAIKLGVIVATYQAGDNARLRCDTKYVGLSQDELDEAVGHRFSLSRVESADDLAQAVFDGKYQLDIDELTQACEMRESELKKQRQALISHFQRAIDLNVLDTDKTHNAIICNLSFANDGTVCADTHDAYDLADAVMNGKFEVDIDNLLSVCKQRELQIEEMKLADMRGGLSREELADKIMQGIVNGALGIEYSQIAPYSHGYEVTFGGDGPIGSTYKFKNRWECYCDFFEIPAKIVDKIEKSQQDGRVFGKNADPLNIQDLLQAIDEMEAKKITSFTPEKDTDFERWGSRGYGSRGSIASVMDVHAGKGLDGIVQHRYHGDYSSMTPSRQNDLVETLVFMKGFCLDCIGNLPGGRNVQEKVMSYLLKQGIDVSTPAKLQAWARQNPEKCGLQQNRDYLKNLARDKEFLERAYCDFVQLKDLASQYSGSVESFCKEYDLPSHPEFGVMACVYGVLYTQLSQNEDGFICVEDSRMDIWDPGRDDFVVEGISISKLKEKCQAFNLNLVELKAKALAEISGKHAGLEEQIRKAEDGRKENDREIGEKEIEIGR